MVMVRCYMMTDRQGWTDTSNGGMERARGGLESGGGNVETERQKRHDCPQKEFFLAEQKWNSG